MGLSPKHSQSDTLRGIEDSDMQPVTVPEIVLHTKRKHCLVVMPDGVPALSYRHTEEIQFRQYLSDLIDLIDRRCLDQFSIDRKLEK